MRDLVKQGSEQDIDGVVVAALPLLLQERQIVAGDGVCVGWGRFLKIEQGPETVPLCLEWRCDPQVVCRSACAFCCDTPCKYSRHSLSLDFARFSNAAGLFARNHSFVERRCLRLVAHNYCVISRNPPVPGCGAGRITHNLGSVGHVAFNDGKIAAGRDEQSQHRRYSPFPGRRRAPHGSGKRPAPRPGFRRQHRGGVATIAAGLCTGSARIEEGKTRK
jgi:hypothetical protein